MHAGVCAKPVAPVAALVSGTAGYVSAAGPSCAAVQPTSSIAIIIWKRTGVSSQVTSVRLVPSRLKPGHET